eukprot:6027277-Pyramimonas_sp.AAC.3
MRQLRVGHGTMQLGCIVLHRTYPRAVMSFMRMMKPPVAVRLVYGRKVLTYTVGYQQKHSVRPVSTLCTSPGFGGFAANTMAECQAETYLN